eukprot:g7789.t1
MPGKVYVFLRASRLRHVNVFVPTGHNFSLFAHRYLQKTGFGVQMEKDQTVGPFEKTKARCGPASPLPGKISLFVKSQLLEKSSRHFLVCVDMVARLGIPASSHLFCLEQSCAVVVWFLA